jgi:hypothetical protein
MFSHLKSKDIVYKYIVPPISVEVAVTVIVISGWIANPVLPHDVKQHLQALHLQLLLVKGS